jgi:hypothetical protein
MAILASLLGGENQAGDHPALDTPARAALAARKSARVILVTHCFSISLGRRGPSRPRPLSRGYTMLLSNFGAAAFVLAMIFAWSFTPALPLEAAHVRG